MQQGEAEAIAAPIADALDEGDDAARATIVRAVQVLGAERAQCFLAQTQAIEHLGGLQRGNGCERRTPGGVYFYLMRGTIERAARRRIFARTMARPSPRGTPLAWFAASAWDEEITDALHGALGEAFSVKITVIGRPKQVVTRAQTIIFSLDGAKPPSMPKGLPPPLAAPAPYMVLVALKQWAKVAPAMEDPQDALIVEGYPVLDPRFKAGITIRATQVTTKHTQAAKRTAPAAGPSASSAQPSPSP